ncbi:MAG: extracellular solute-binding protein [Clostridia bacterium]|nr:extracellular solute-binding protein [Clostridia bacterium]
MQKRMTAMLLASLLLTVSCGQTDETVSEETSAAVNTEAAATETEKQTPDLANTDYDGHTFRFIYFDNTIANEWVGIPCDLDVDEVTGDALSDSVYYRNLTVEEAMNVTIVADSYVDDVYNVIQQSVTAGSADFDAAYHRLNQMSNLVNGGYLYDLNTIDAFDFSDPWWDANSADALTVKNRLFGIVSDVTYFDKLAAYVVFYNQNMAADHQIGDMYEMVENGEWTFDAMNAISETVAVDLDGDGTFGPEDSYGLSCQNDGVYILLHAAGQQVAKTDENGEIAMTLQNEAAVDALQTIYEIMFSGNLFFNRQTYSMNVSDAINMFIENRTLFLIRPVQTMMALREMEADFGIIPIPKYDENRANYSTSVNPYACIFMCLPLSVADTTRSADILEALACESYYNVIEPLYETVLGDKLVRDSRSTEMLDLIFDNRVYDLGLIWDFGGITQKLLENKSTDVVSMLASVESKVQDAIDALMEAIESYAG